MFVRTLKLRPIACVLVGTVWVGPLLLMDVQCMELFVNKKSERCRRQLYNLRAAFGVVRKRQVKVRRCLGCLKRYKEKKKNKQTNKKEQQNNQKRREKKVRRRREERRKEIKRDGQTFYLFIVLVAIGVFVMVMSFFLVFLASK